MTSLSVFDAAREAPTREALRFEGEAWSYAELAERTAGACEGMLAQGIQAGRRVALCASNHPNTLVALMALMELGATAVPLHPRLTPREREALIADASPWCVLGDSELAELALRRGDPEALTVSGAEWVIYTSGTTGSPKGAVLTRASVEASARASEANLGWIAHDRWILCLPLCHIGGLSIVTRCVMARQCVVLTRRFEAGEILATLERENITLASVVPTMLRGLMDKDSLGVMRAPRAVLVGGAAAPRELMERAVSQGLRVLATYGLTEACSQVTAWRLSPDGRARMCKGSGRALEGFEVEVCGDDEKPLKTGQIGRIRIRGTSLMQGYLHGEALAGGFFDTGDLGALDAEGNLYVASRRTDLLVTGGENVYPAEVEGFLESLPGVSRAVVFGLHDARWGQLVAAAVVRDDQALEPTLSDETSLREAMEEGLARHKWARRVCFVREVPMGTSGKVDRAESVKIFTPRVRPWRRA